MAAIVGGEPALTRILSRRQRHSWHVRKCLSQVQAKFAPYPIGQRTDSEAHFFGPSCRVWNVRLRFGPFVSARKPYAALAHGIGGADYRAAPRQRDPLARDAAR